MNDKDILNIIFSYTEIANENNEDMSFVKKRSLLIRSTKGM